ncbi:serine/threonine-protein kinase [Nocardioides caldifontis]|uniref:serine/threonine-protein kinase n=1 Tax=Nocardioides caldifontis TaxID=2588938 RepID=UPI00193A5C4A|nr:serine/threonine-protein kinase [Nocardioides caldifontis]
MFRSRERGVAGQVPVGEEVLPGYEVVALLAHGKRVDTYDVWSTERECRCIVKVLRPDRCHEPEARAAVEREGRVLRELQHPHLVRCYEVHTGPVPAMVLETLTGATLAALVDDEPLGVRDSALLGLQLSSVLGYLHRHGWLHLDVKPENVVVEQGKATLLDLSLVGRPGDGRPGAGTRGYLAPEQALGRDLSPATDVWGLGVTLVEALTGEQPHGDEATWDSLPRRPLLHRRAPRPPGPIPGLPTAYDEVLRRTLERDPAARPTLAELRAVLTAVLDEE